MKQSSGGRHVTSGRGLRTLRPCDRRARQRDRIPERAHAGRGPVTASLANPGAPAGERIELNFGGSPGEWERERAAAVLERDGVWMPHRKPRGKELADVQRCHDSWLAGGGGGGPQ